ncbi:MAG: 1-deoxy-D-xylulose-5-phosphate reductoisomerase [Candidatus Eremiobacteraeota bacterium]|nr:1-deoxy-D-xylulose-5-phosphate reductoisomerase [Candidatus Eremiobacteraeota bacterium]MBC5826301.1 1-deoxy-D-xylulose-5-phosphate reductoisomerase [Candidatus Eremiobacteraeota bacterium]
MRRIAILGATGSIGRQALEVIDAYPEHFQVSALVANRNVQSLAATANRLRPPLLAAGTPESAAALSDLLTYPPQAIGYGPSGLLAAATLSGADMVLAATDGMVSLAAVSAALERRIDVALANKELAVAAGEPLFAQARRTGAALLPVDSEHSAVFQCAVGERAGDIASVLLTASGGPCWGLNLAELKRVTPEQALRHPTWDMGPKNSLDSATMMNKGLEVIEASRFFSLSPSQVEVVVHRQSVAHAFVLFCDGSIKGQFASPDMRLPIGYALAYPKRLPMASAAARALDVLGARAPVTLTFEPVDATRFPAIRLAYRALKAGGTYPAVLSAANERAGRAFMRGKVRFTDIAVLIERALDAHDGRAATFSEIEDADRWARSATDDAISSIT